MKDLVIGNTSQLSYYFNSDECEKISSRNINVSKFENKFYNRVYVTFAEQRTFSNLSLNDFNKVNFDYTKYIIDFFSKICNKLIYYSTIELWNKSSGPITIATSFYHNNTPYVLSKRKMTDFILENRYENVIVIFPVNFNSIYRKSGFLFSKIYDSIINKSYITINNVNFYRDIVHAKFIANQSKIIDKNELVGSGHLTNIRDFIISLYDYYNMDYESFVLETCVNKTSRQEGFFVNNNIKYDNLFIDTIEEINREMINAKNIFG